MTSDGLQNLVKMIEKLTIAREPFACYTGRGVKVGIIDSGVNPAHPHVGGVAGGTRITSGESDSTNDYLDYIGHGTAVAGAIREKAPEGLLYAVKVFDRALTTNIETIIKAIDWCIENEIEVINLSLGTVNVEHREKIEAAVARAAEEGTVLVAAREMSGQPSLPGCLRAVIAVAVDWNCPRDTYRVAGRADERNLNGISFAVANMTGFVTRAREFAPTAQVDRLKQLLVAGSTKE
ncbi:MAG: hypothetical protein DMF60_19530 [Acidobacteria bacterium]|nr:MAG: hypothetical protein DMF60_19530 [Acidobacteriota bacterium]